ncbi:MAG TPA: GIY-YIG nuclease family protein [bacterium]|nr:GIY-YIG nuclease family protein [bacterium]
MRRSAFPARASYFAYLLRCGDGTFYAGYTRDPSRRLLAHREGRAARYTRGRGPWEFAAMWRCRTMRDALRLEHLLKRLGREGRLRLVRGTALVQVIPAAAELGARRVGPAILVR